MGNNLSMNNPLLTVNETYKLISKVNDSIDNMKIQEKNQDEKDLLRKMTQVNLSQDNSLGSRRASIDRYINEKPAF